MDYRYETKDSARDFHRQRKAFIILDNKLEFLPEGTAMSHFEYCQTTKGLEKEAFNKITRGYFINGSLVFYKDNFIYDDAVINEGLKYIKEIASTISETQFEIYFGLLLDQNFAFDLHYGKYDNGNIIKRE